MRVSTYWQFRQMERTVERSTDRLSQWQQRVSTGKRVIQPSDDPVGTVHALALRQQMSHLEQYNRTIREARTFLQATEQALADIGEVINAVRQIITQGANDTLDQQGRDALVQQVRTLRQRLMQLGNQRVEGERYLFSGQNLHTQPFELVGTTLVYNGDGNPLLATIAFNRTIAMNFPGARIADLYNKLNEVESHLLAGNSAALSNVDLQDIQQFQLEFQRYRGEIGVRLRELRDYELLHTARRDQLSESLAEIEEVDLAEAISQLRQAELSYQAALQVFSRVQTLNLFDLIRGG